MSRRSAPVLIVAAIGLAALVAALLTSGNVPTFPEGETVRGHPPRLAVRSASCWSRVDRAMLFAVHGDRIEVRTSYDPPDGGPAVRPFPRDGDPTALPWPEEDEVAAVLEADPDEPWVNLRSVAFPPEARFAFRGVYLGGTKRDGTRGAVPLYARRPRELFDLASTLGQNMVLRDLTLGDPAYELEIVRRGDRVRYRWGHELWTSQRTSRDGGEVTIAAHQARDGRTSDLEPLREFLRKARPRNPFARARIVLLEANAEARYVDVLRAVECGEGSTRVWFLPYPGMSSSVDLERLQLAKSGPDPSGVLHDGWHPDPRRWSIVNVFHDGTLVYGRYVPRRPADLVAKLRVNRDAGVLLRADERAPWSACRPVVRVARELGRDLAASVAPEPGLSRERRLDFPATPVGRPAVDGEVERLADGELDLVRSPREGEVLRRRIPDDVPAGAVIRLLVRLRTAGVQVVLE